MGARMDITARSLVLTGPRRLEWTQQLLVGERVVGFYGHRTAALVPASKAIRVPEGVSDELALLTILTCDAAKGVRKITPLPEEPVLVTGAGAIGLFTLFILKAYGSAAVDVVDPAERRHRLARALGARAVWRPAGAATGAAELPAGF